MKKYLVFFLCILCLVGCTNKSSKEAVIEYLEKYRNFTAEIEESLMKDLESVNWTKEQKEKYILLMKKQFVNLKYKIKEEIYNGEEATVLVDITVYNYHNSKREALKEQDESQNYIDKVLEKMNNETHTIKYTLVFKTNYKEGVWVLEQPSEETLKKIEGIYNET